MAKQKYKKNKKTIFVSIVLIIVIILSYFLFSAQDDLAGEAIKRSTKRSTMEQPTVKEKYIADCVSKGFGKSLLEFLQKNTVKTWCGCVYDTNNLETCAKTHFPQSYFVQQCIQQFTMRDFTTSSIATYCSCTVSTPDQKCYEQLQFVPQELLEVLKFDRCIDFFDDHSFIFFQGKKLKPKSFMTPQDIAKTCKCITQSPTLDNAESCKLIFQELTS